MSGGCSKRTYRYSCCENNGRKLSLVIRAEYSFLGSFWKVLLSDSMGLKVRR